MFAARFPYLPAGRREDDVRRVLLVFVACIALVGFASPNALVVAIRLTDALSTPNGLTVRGVISNNYSVSENAKCGDTSFALLGNGQVYQGLSTCQASEIAPSAKSRFEVVFPPVMSGVYFLRYLKTSTPVQYEIIPLRVRIKVSP